MSFHYNPKTNKTGTCRAQSVETCPLVKEFGEEAAPHFANDQEAKDWIVTKEAEENPEFDTVTVGKKHRAKLKTDKQETVSEPQQKMVGVNGDTYEFKTYGVGKAKKVSGRKGKYWPEDMQVTVKETEGTPEKLISNSGKPIHDVEEVSVNGEVVGYIYKGDEGWGGERIGFQTLEEMNDPESPLIPQSYSRLSAMSELIEHNNEYVNKKFEVDEENRFGNVWRKNPKLTQIDEDTQVYEESEQIYSGGSTLHKVYWIKKGRPVGFIKYSYDENSNYLSMYDIETRHSDRRKGYGSELRKYIETRHDSTMISSGTFTPLGRVAFGKIAVVREGGPTPDKFEMYGVRPMNFIASWDRLLPYRD